MPKKQHLVLIGKDTYCGILSALYRSNHCFPLPKTKASFRQQLYQYRQEIKHKTQASNININVILIVDSLHQAQSLLPCTVVAGCPVGLVFADMLQPTSAWLIQQQKSRSKKPYAVLAQWMDNYRQYGTTWLNAWRDTPPYGYPVENWMADVIDGDQLCEKLATGARCCVYFGHGRPYGFAAYHGIYLDDIQAITLQQPVDCFLSFGCYHLTETNEAKSFAQILCESGRVGAFWGTTQAVDSQANAQLAAIAFAASQQCEVQTLGQWLCAIEVQVVKMNDTELQAIWHRYYLLGDPRMILF